MGTFSISSSPFRDFEEYVRSLFEVPRLREVEYDFDLITESRNKLPEAYSRYISLQNSRPGFPWQRDLIFPGILFGYSKVITWKDHDVT
jgi:hypothetical protein